MSYDKEMNELYYMQQVYATLFSLSNKIRIAGDRSLGDLSSKQYMAIVTIFHLPENEAILSNVAKKLGTTKQNVRQLVNILEKKNYVEVGPHPRNKRAVIVSLTQAGYQEMMRCAESRVLLLTEIFKGFDERELQALWHLMVKLYRFDGMEEDSIIHCIPDSTDSPA